MTFRSTDLRTWQGWWPEALPPLPCSVPPVPVSARCSPTRPRRSPSASSGCSPLKGSSSTSRQHPPCTTGYQAVPSASSPGGPARVPIPRCGPRPDVPSPTPARSSPPARGASSIATSRDGRYAHAHHHDPACPITRLLYLAQGVAERPPPGSARGSSYGQKPRLRHPDLAHLRHTHTLVGAVDRATPSTTPDRLTG